MSDYGDTNEERVRELTETGKSIRRTGRPIMTMIAEALGPDTSRTHEFLISGCRNQWTADHDHAHCWAAFLAHHGAPAGLGIDEFYA